MNSRLPDPALVTQAVQGTDVDVDRLARAWLPLVYAWCHRLGGPGVDAEDAAHETLIAMCRNLARVRSPEVFPAWLFGITRRVLANHRGRAWFRRWVPWPAREPASEGWGPHRTAEANEAAAQVWRVLQQLTETQREVLVLCELEERSGAEAAELLGVPLGTVKSRLRLAKDAFRRSIEADANAARASAVGVI